jgi:hypothetical protein
MTSIQNDGPLVGVVPEDFKGFEGANVEKWASVDEVNKAIEFARVSGYIDESLSVVINQYRKQ